MPWPKLNYYGVVANPVNFSPYVTGNDGESESPIPANTFLLLNGMPFALLGGGNLLLLG